MDRFGCRTLVVLAAGMGERFGGCKQLTSVGPGGETIVEYLAHEAWSAGFGRVVVVTRADLADEVNERLARRFRARHGDPSPSIDVVEQPAGLRGTVPAVLAARQVLAGEDMFGVANADDLYPLDAFRALRSWDGAGHAVVGFRLARTMLPGSTAINRALCRTRDLAMAGHGQLDLVALTEAAVVGRATPEGGPDDRWFVRDLAAAGAGESSVPGTQLVSMNLWVLRSTIWPLFEAELNGDRPSEVLLPVVIGQLVAREQVQVQVLPVDGRCFGITWPEDLAPLRALVVQMVAAGELPAPAAIEEVGQS